IKDINNESILIKNFIFNKDTNNKNENLYLRIIEEIINIQNEKNISIDGIIFQPNMPYKNDKTKKWKAVDDITLDLYVKNNNNIYSLYAWDGKNNVLWKDNATIEFNK